VLTQVTSRIANWSNDSMTAVCGMLTAPTWWVARGGDDPMSMGTINVLLGVISILFAFAVAVGALAFAVEGFIGRGKLYRLYLPLALALWAWAGTTVTSAGQSFARASEPILRQPAEATDLIPVLFWTLMSVAILVTGIRYFRGLYRSLTAVA
jgi:hypothetical protein